MKEVLVSNPEGTLKGVLAGTRIAQTIPPLWMVCKKFHILLLKIPASCQEEQSCGGILFYLPENT